MSGEDDKFLVGKVRKNERGKWEVFKGEDFVMLSCGSTIYLKAEDSSWEEYSVEHARDRYIAIPVYYDSNGDSHLNWDGERYLASIEEARVRRSL